MDRDTFLVFGAPDIRDAEIEEVVATLRSGWIGTGPRTEKFEAAFAEYIGAKHAVALSSCTAGLELALEVFGIGPGDEVITTPMTFCATANVIVHRGAKPVFVDVDPRTGLIDLNRVEGAITRRTRAIIPVHLYGRPVAMRHLLDLARRHDLHIVEDAAHAIEAWDQGRKIGTIGDVTAFSFYVTKNLVTGEGGMLTTGDAKVAEKVRVMRLHGLTKDAWDRYSDKGFRSYDVVAAGYKMNMTDLQAAMGLHQLARIEENLARRREIWKKYDNALCGVAGITTPPPFADSSENDHRCRHGRHLYTIRINEEKLGIGRWEFVRALKERNIGSGVHFLPVHLHKFYRKTFGYKNGDYPNAERIGNETVSLPLSSALADSDVDDVIEAVLEIAEEARSTGA